MDIIDSFNKLTLGKYAEIQAISANESLEEVDRVVGILSVLSGATEEEILHLPIAEFTEMSARMKFLSAAGFKAGRIARKYKIGEWELFPVTDYRRLETAQYLDFQTFVADMENRMPELISVILVPKGHRYNDGYDIIEMQKAIRDNMSVTDGATIVGFFMTLCARSIKDSLHFSRQAAQGIRDKAKKTEILGRIAEQEKAFRTSGVG